MPSPRRALPISLLLRLARAGLWCSLALAQPALAAGTRQLATGGATQIEGAAGGGMVPWAVIAGYGGREETGANAFITRIDTGDFRLDVRGASVGIRNRVELSFARQELDLVTLGPALGLPGASLDQDVFGAKLRLAGDVLYTAWPQISVGAQYKRQRDFLVPGLVGAADDSGVDLYVSATKVFLAAAGGYNLVANATLRRSEANETGLLGFGGDGDRGHDLLAEGSLALLLDRHWAVGAEYRSKRGHLATLPEDDWWDAFVAWFPNRHVSVVLARADLGTVATLPDQDGWYLSITAGF
jgi:hypothetical protein